ncbi:hypothetical protein BCR34DRAFT_598798 [Clohesyomyces aquaticus]|uniref:P-loop containing nucleoside triphosphate hydrolase protein n=1 Tax=Clohesyomyces aquaticus TaxID=1231657 RepID=A0A1Y1ZXA9_9PLEO|nr:hypothetical protein BCR34DRAFT_598798 [Clohesyomyces aquaticus]
MDSLERIDGLSECIAQAIQGHLAKSNLEWPENLIHPMLRVEAFLEDGLEADRSNSRSERIASRTLDLTGFVTPAPSRSPTVLAPEFQGDPGLPGCESQDNIYEQSGPDPTSDQEHVNSQSSDPEAEPETCHRRGLGGLRVAQTEAIQEDPSAHQRQMQSDNRNFPKRRKVVSEKLVFQPSTLDKLIIGIWEQIHGTLSLDPRSIFEQFQITPAGTPNVIQRQAAETSGMDLFSSDATLRFDDSFSKMNVFCKKVTQASRVCRSIEIVVQSRWIELFESQVQLRLAGNPEISTAKHRKATFMDACKDFGWSEKELRNKMAIWRGYKEVKDAAGWAALVFAGMGIYRFCKYRVSFDRDAMRRLRSLRNRLEVAADTLHPNWRQLLSIVGESPALRYTGHPHDWVVFEDGSDPVPLGSAYLQYDPHFTFENVDESIIDEHAWNCDDPRWIPQSNSVLRMCEGFICASCHEQQSDDPRSNSCYCFLRLFGCVKRSPPPVQIFRTPDGRNNGLVALTPFERGDAIGEFVGLITKGITDLDVMDGSTPLQNYQIWQGDLGNFTRFVNHSCRANSQVERFTWLDTQRVVLVSKGIEAGVEITVDYSDRYWGGLDKGPAEPRISAEKIHDFQPPAAHHHNDNNPICSRAVMGDKGRISKVKVARLKARQPSPDSALSVSTSDEEITEHQQGSRKRRKLSPSPVEDPKPDAATSLPNPTLSRVKIKRPEIMLAQASAQDTALTAVPGKEKTTFASINVAPWLIASLSAMEIKRPTGIQKACIPEILDGRDCIGGSRTGTGKTVAFAAPILQKWAEDPVGIYAVIITPTRELAIQIFEQIKAISAPQSLKPVLITGGADQREQALNLASRPHIVIATPGRLAEHIKTSGEETICGLRRVRFVVFDEADRLLAPGRGSMLPDLETCLSALPPSEQRQTLLFTATVTPEVLALKDQPRSGRPPIFICEVDTETLAIPPKLQQKFLQTPVTHKDCYLHVLLSTPENLKRSVIIFCNRTATANVLEHLLRLLAHRVTALHSGLPQPSRISNLARFRAQAARILVATDVAARGLDIPEVALVINYDVPRDPDDYIHRVGRTARAGRVGTSVTMIGQRDVDLMFAIEDRVGKKMEEYAEEGVSFENRLVKGDLKLVTEKRREALLQIEEGKDVLGKRNKGMQRLKR